MAMFWWNAALVATALVLAGCGSTPKGGGPRGGPLVVERDGPGTAPPRNLHKLPDAVPRVEPIPAGGPNRPYEIGGRSYTPFTHDRPFAQRGLASWYGSKFHGRRTSNGEVYDMYAMTAAHPTMPLPSYVRVRNPANDREVILRVNDRGPFHPDRVIDLSYAAAFKLGLLRGVGVVELERITHQDIRGGNWQRSARRPVPAPPVADEEPAADEAPGSGTAGGPTGVAGGTPAGLATGAGGAAGAAALLPAAAIAPAAAGAASNAGSGLGSGATGSASSGFWVQLAAFRDAEGAADFRRRVEAEVDWLGPLLTLVPDRALHRLQVGPYASRDDAQAAAQRIREALQLVPLVVVR